MRLLAVQSEPQGDDVALDLGQRLHRLAQAVVLEVRDDLLLDGRPLAGDQVAEGGLAVLTDALVEARGATVRATDVGDLVYRQVHELGDLLLRRLAAELDGELALGVRDLARPRDDVHRQADGAARVGEAAADGLTDPERPVGGELEALAPVELLDRADQAEHALLDQVREGRPCPDTCARPRSRAGGSR